MLIPGIVMKGWIEGSFEKEVWKILDFVLQQKFGSITEGRRSSLFLHNLIPIKSST
jgi:hypothetical protein